MGARHCGGADTGTNRKRQRAHLHDTRRKGLARPGLCRGRRAHRGARLRPTRESRSRATTRRGEGCLEGREQRGHFDDGQRSAHRHPTRSRLRALRCRSMPGWHGHPVRRLPRSRPNLRRLVNRNCHRACAGQRTQGGARKRGVRDVRMIERWFPCAEVSEASGSGWGSGKSEKALFTWFAARPLAQAKAAVLTSLLPWPDDETEQRRLQDLVRTAMTGRDAAHSELAAELAKAYPDGASMLDPFSGRAMIPLEAARLGVAAHGVDYSPVATLAGQLLAEFPLRDWAAEPDLPFGPRDTLDAASRLLDDVRLVLREIGKRYADRMIEAYPMVQGKQPWGYLWAITLPCQECGHRFPLTGSLVLRHPVPDDPGQSYRIEADRRSGEFRVVVHDGSSVGQPTLVSRTRDGKALKGKSAVCPFCEHVHSKQTHQRLAQEGLGRDCLLAAADLDERVGKKFREPTVEERAAIDLASILLAQEQSFGEFPAVPNEGIPVGNNDTVRASAYGAKTYGDLCNSRQPLGFVRLSRIISDLGSELTVAHGLSERY